MSATEQIVNMFTGISKLDDYSYPSDFNNISVQNFDPPAYIVRMVLIDLLELTDYGPMDKVRWHTIFNYKDKTFLIRDYKFGSWSVESKTNDETTKEIVSEIKNKIKIASNNLNRFLYEHLKHHAQKGDFYITNLKHSLSSIFHFYMLKTKEAIGNVKNLKPEADNKDGDDVSSIDAITDVWNKKLKLTEVAFNYAYSIFTV